MVANPNPVRLAEVLDADAVCHHRSLFCPEYDACLEVAASGGWTSWSCEHCPLAGGQPGVLVLLRDATAASGAPGDPVCVAAS